MRAVLKTVAQCHVHNILHRDIKPGNFMLASKADDARIKAIDFGLAVPYKEGEPTDFTMQGTPWWAPLVFLACPLQDNYFLSIVGMHGFLQTYLTGLLITAPIIGVFHRLEIQRSPHFMLRCGCLFSCYPA